jgi:glycerophosphoryl diester phosphodiesterase
VGLTPFPAGSRAAENPVPPAATAVIAHRGAWGEARENSLAAFERAIALSADMIEFDVRRTGDGCLVVHHDAHLYGVRLASLTAADLAWAGARSPPRLDEVLELAKGRIAVDVELKEPGYVDDVLVQLKRFGLERCLVTSFLDSVILECKLLAPELATGLLIGFGPPRLSIRRLLRARADYLAPHFRLAEAVLLRQADAAGRRCLLWTVNHPRPLERYLLDPRVAGIISDTPAGAIQRRDRLTSRTESAVLR